MHLGLRSSILLLRASHGIVYKRTIFIHPKRELVPALQRLTSARLVQVLTKNYSTNIESVHPDSKEVLYRYKWIKQLRLISRIKILHVCIVGGLTGPMPYWYSQGIISGSVLVTSIFAATATTAGLFALSYFFRRVIGELSFDLPKEEITISSLTFWGNRRNLVVPMSNLVPQSDRGFNPNSLFHRVELYDSDFVYLLNLRHGMVYNRETLMALLGFFQEHVKNVNSCEQATGDVVESGETVGKS